MPQGQSIPPQQNPPPPQNSLGLADFMPVILPFLGIFILLFLRGGARKTKIPDDMPQARFATKGEIKQGNNEARRQIAAGKLTETALCLSPESGVTFAYSNPGGTISGMAGSGKTANGVFPLIFSAIGQDHTVFVTDVEGELMTHTAAYALSKGYDMHVYAPGVEDVNSLGEWAQFTGSFNFADVMRHLDDKSKAQEITRALNVNTQEDTQKRHAYFGPQTDALLETALMLAKGSEYQDMLMVWAILTLPDLADRLDAAEKEGRFNENLSYFAKQSSAGLRAVAGSGGKGDSPSASIQSSAFNSFSKFIDPAVARVLLPSTIPLEHSGKSIIYFRPDRTQLKSTAPLVATALHLLLTYNLDPQRHREVPLTLISDEANFFILPCLEDLAKLARKKGGNFWLTYQQNSGMELAYGKERWKGIFSNLKNKMYFNTGESDYHDKISKDLHNKTIITATASNSYGSNNQTQGTSDQLKEVPLVPASKLSDQKRPGHCVIVSGSYPHPVNFLDKPIPYDPNSRFIKIQEKCKESWVEDILPALQEESKTLSSQRENPDTREVEYVSIKEEIENREEIADLLLPHPKTIALDKLAEENERKRLEREKLEEEKQQNNDGPVTVLPNMFGGN